MRVFFDEQELQERIDRNYNRFLDDPYYMIDQVFDSHECEWPGDKEGRALLSYVSHYKINGRKVPCMDQMIDCMKDVANEHFFFGPLANEIIFEQQLSGHSWLLRGLCEYYEQFSDARVLEQIESIWENLFKHTKGRYASYPVDRDTSHVGEISGESMEIIDGWKLSSDVGCAFMSIDGLSHAYVVTKNAEIRELLDEMIDVYLAIDKVKLKVQTHCTLSAARGMMRLYAVTLDKKYLIGAQSIYDLYVYGGGMTLTYQNANWWGRYDTWTEPCAIVDSLMLAIQLFEATGNEEYRVLAARVYHNGLATAQRDNGGAGCDKVVLDVEGAVDHLILKAYEACFCCTMRLSEGLWFINEKKHLLYATVSGDVEKDERGVYRDGDIIYAQVSKDGEKFVNDAVEKDGIKLCPILKYYRLPSGEYERIRQKIIFK